jgi:uncharacterized OB-fold protein
VTTKVEKVEVSTKIRPRIGRWEVDDHNEVALLGTHCAACGEVAFPEHQICVNCGSESTEVVRIKGPATLRNYTIVHQLPPGFERPWVVGYGDFNGQLVVLAPIVAASPDDLHEGMPLSLCVGVTKVDDDGEEMNSYQFTPLKA